MTAPRRARFRFIPLSTALLVLVALGTSGFAVAADRQPAAEQHPPALALAGLLDELEPFAADVHEAGRELTGHLQALQPDAAATAAADGDGAVVALEARLPELDGLRDEVDDVGQPAAAADSVATVPDHWRAIIATARTVVSLTDALDRDEELVFAATGAARDSNWDASLELLDGARAPLAEASVARAALAEADGDVGTLDDLLSRYEAYDAALVALYSHISDSGSREGAEFDELRDDVDRAQAALPRNDEVLAVIVGEAAAPAIAGHLVALEQARDAIDEALAR